MVYRLGPEAAPARVAARAAAVDLATAAAVAVTLFSFLVPDSASAVPQFAARTGFTCGSCHFDRGGGGPRKEMGFLFARQRHDLAPDTTAIGQSMSELTNRLSDWFYFGTNTRLLYLYDDPEAYGSVERDRISNFFQMQSALYTTVRPHERLLLHWTLDYNEFSGASTRDVYGMIEGFPADGYVRAGRFRLPFGLRWEDHTTGTRYGFLAPESGDVGGALPYDPRAPQAGVEIGAVPGNWFGALSFTSGEFGYLGGDAHTLVAKWGVNYRPVQLAISGYDSYRSQDGSRALRWGAYGIFGWRDLALVAEVVGGENWNDDVSTTRIAALATEATWRFSRAVSVAARYDFSDRDRDTDGFAAERFGGEAIWTVVPFADLRIAYRRIIPETSGDVNQIQAQWHLYY
jgi:hypothetical protein